MAREPITELPADYHEVKHLTANSLQAQVLLNLAALIPLYLMILFMNRWLAFVRSVRGANEGGDAAFDIIIVFVTLFGVLLLHEWLHGLAISWYGHRARYGAKALALGPIKIPAMLYATTDNGLFRRHEFIVIALAPLVVITLLGMVLGFFVPDRWHFYLALFVALNAGGAIGDMWMTWVVLRYPASALVRDEADSISVYTGS
jgi:hypothetical protein